MRQVEGISSEALLACNQCGKCSAGCPIAPSLDILPNQVIRLAQLGIEDVLDSQMIWACAACMNCVAHCPKGIDLPRVMEALRLIAMAKKGDRLVGMVSIGDVVKRIISERDERIKDLENFLWVNLI